jgi:hypothetical protein
VTLRYFAGGSLYNLAVMFGISICQVYTSAWKVVRAITNDCSMLKIEFPTTHASQQHIANDGFRERSDANFGCCVLAAIDGMRIWIERPSLRDCQSANCGPKNFSVVERKNLD